MRWFTDLLQYDFAHRPMESLGKGLILVFIVAPFVGAFIYMESSKNNLAGRGGVIIRRAANAAIEETRPDYRKYIDSNREFEIQPARRNQP